MKIKVPNATASRFLRAIPHATCQRGIPKYWRVDPQGTIAHQSAYWLACWAWTGMGSDDAAREAQIAFDAIMPFPFSKFKANVPHKTARKNRYRTNSCYGPSLEGLV